MLILIQHTRPWQFLAVMAASVKDSPLAEQPDNAFVAVPGFPQELDPALQHHEKSVGRSVLYEEDHTA